MADGLLPSEFAELERFLPKWDRPSTNERYAQRLSSEYAELEDFHEVFGKRLAEIKSYLDAKAFDDYSEPDLALARLAFAWVPVAEAVEVFKQPRVPDSKMYWNIEAEPEL